MAEKTNFQGAQGEISTIARGTGIVFIGTIMGTGLKYLFQILIARNLGTELFGIFILGLAIFSIAEIATRLGLPNGVIRYVAIYHGEGDERRSKGIILSAMKISICSSVVIASSMMLLSKTFALDLFHKTQLTNVLRFFALAIPFSTLTAIFVSSTMGFKIVKYRVFVLDMFEPLLRITLAMALSFIGLRLYGVVMVYLTPILLGTVLAFYYLKNTFPAMIQKEVSPIFETKTLFSFSWPLAFNYLAGILVLWTDILMIGYLKTSREVGIYSVAQKTALFGEIVLNSFNFIFAPIISDLYHKGDWKKLKHFFKTVTKWILTFSLPIFISMVVFAKGLLNLFGSEFTQGVLCLIILSMGWILVPATFGSVNLMITMTGRSKLQLANAAALLVLNVTLNLLLIPRYGMLGAAIATASSAIVIKLLTLFEVTLILNIHPFQTGMTKPFIAGGLSFLFVRYVFQLQDLLLIGIPILFTSYLMILLLLGIGEEEKMVLRMMRTRVTHLFR